VSTTKTEDRFAEVRAILHNQGSPESVAQKEGMAAASKIISDLADTWDSSEASRADHHKATGILAALAYSDFQEAVRILQSA